MSLPGYDAWKLATPPETDPAPVPCTNCDRLDCDCGDADEPDRDDATEAEADNDATR
jgi:hypothetical protein